MNEQQKVRMQQLRWEAERIAKKLEFLGKVQSLLNETEFEILSFQESDDFQLKSEDWPDLKWKQKLFVQTEINTPLPMENIVRNFTSNIPSDFALIFLLNYNFGLIKINNASLMQNWSKLIELDGDEMYCYNPDDSCFLCIEKTEDLIKGRENEGSQWIYEATFSNSELKRKLIESI